MSKKKLTTNRAEMILSAIIDSYIEDGTPIGSKKLASNEGFNLSSATIRNVMSDLEDLGFIASPHTSSGRIPTPKGYRFFIDSLLQHEPIEQDEYTSIENTVSALTPSNKDLALSVSSTLSTITNLAGIVTVPRKMNNILKEIDFIPLSDQRILAIIVINQKEVENKILQMKRDYTRDELQRSANYLNQNYSGRSLEFIKEDLLNQLKETSDLAKTLMNNIIDIANDVLTTDDNDDYFVTGESHLMDHDELSDIKRLKALFNAFMHSIVVSVYLWTPTSNKSIAPKPSVPIGLNSIRGLMPMPMKAIPLKAISCLAYTVKPQSMPTVLGSALTLGMI